MCAVLVACCTARTTRVLSGIYFIKVFSGCDARSKFKNDVPLPRASSKFLVPSSYLLPFLVPSSYLCATVIVFLRVGCIYASRLKLRRYG